MVQGKSVWTYEDDVLFFSFQRKIIWYGISPSLLKSVALKYFLLASLVKSPIPQSASSIYHCTMPLINHTHHSGGLREHRSSTATALRKPSRTLPSRQPRRPLGKDGFEIYRRGARKKGKTGMQKNNNQIDCATPLYIRRRNYGEAIPVTKWQLKML